MYSPAHVRRALDRVLASPQFSGSERMTRFLRFVVEKQLAGRGSELKEYVIGTEVFDRDSKYDSRLDPIVRVEARRLRTKLEAYYSSDGKDDPVRIVLPKGSYAPDFTEASGKPQAIPNPLEGTPSIVVLPFENTSRETDAEYLSDGLTQQIIHRLTRVKGMRVVGWNSAARMRERHDRDEVARELNASTVLSGSVRASGGRLRITAQLADSVSGQFLWSEYYDRSMEDLLSIEVEIASAIVDALQVQFGLAREGPRCPEAYKLYFQARYHWNRRTADGLRRAVELMRQSLDLDPSYALAWAGLADCYVLMSDYAVMESSQTVELARKAAQQALELSPCLGEAECSLAMIRCLHDWEWDDAEIHFQRAMELNPSYATTYHWYAVDYSVLRGRQAEAITAIETALELEPLSSIIREGRGYIDMIGGRLSSALAEYKRVMELDPTFHKAWTSMGRILIELGDYPGAIEALQRARQLLGESFPRVLGALGQAYAKVGNHEKAREMLGEIKRIAQSRFVPVSGPVAVHLGLEEHEEALRWLQYGFERRDVSLCQIAVHPLYKPLRNHLRFIDLVDRVGCLRPQRVTPAAPA